MAEIADRISQLCTRLAADGTYLQDAAERAGAAEALSRIRAAVRDAETPPGTARLLHDLDVLDQAMARTGHGYVTLPDRVYMQFPGRPPAPTVEVAVCPAPHACTRLVRARDTDDTRVCAITGQALKSVRYMQ
ncbi:MAG: hypothetical protein HOV68_05940 [Streptomycetaceae bacterium]|nr:hypothetical protein [Streptomycetaceae bacterium]